MAPGRATAYAPAQTAQAEKSGSRVWAVSQPEAVCPTWLVQASDDSRLDGRMPDEEEHRKAVHGKTIRTV